MKKIVLFLLLSLNLLVNSSFKQTGDCFSSVFDLIVQSKWTKTQNLEDLDLDGNFVEYGKDCEKDDGWAFKPDGILIHEPSAILCDSTDLTDYPLSNIRWSLGGEDQFLLLDYQLDDTKYRIGRCDSHQLVLILWDEDAPDIVKYKIILSR